ncbi:hypothetical protein [Kutzneria sp. 744]|uniref:hypothetical protein n=1 Tax=Kutzneria sp. (strain 744) TaxID=345341 RepID=UPI0003EEAC11|nr:hypothetical protein [Kutzneria sp. 744]EWM15091.1 hypothetical protein KUTG_05395 [Kutzneria sp. 744]
MEKMERFSADLASISAITAPFGAVAGEYAGISGGQITVNHDTVLQAGKIIQQQVDQLNSITRPKLQNLFTGVLGGDDVSQAATLEWTKILVSNDDSYTNRIGQYIDGLEKLAEQLKTAAQQYGFTEEQIKDAFGVK